MPACGVCPYTTVTEYSLKVVVVFVFFGFKAVKVTSLRHSVRHTLLL